MAAHRNARYPSHLAELVTKRLIANGDTSPSDTVLLHLFETLYFASLKTDEARPCQCTVNYIDPSADQQYGHGGGLLIVPSCPVPDVNIKYEQTYDRLPTALFRLAQRQILKRQTAETIAAHCNTQGDTLPCEVHFDAVHAHNELDRLKNELLGCVHFIAALSRVDGFVLLDKSLVVHGFGVEARADAGLTDVYMAGDAKASTNLLRQAPLSQFGTRHRAMMRYCDEHEGALGFVISQDGDIRATMKYRDRLVLWENINVQLAYRAENRSGLITDFSPTTISGLFHHWMHSVSNVRSA